MPRQRFLTIRLEVKSRLNAEIVKTNQQLRTKSVFGVLITMTLMTIDSTGV